MENKALTLAFVKFISLERTTWVLSERVYRSASQWYSASLPQGGTKLSFSFKGWTHHFCPSDSQTCVSFVLHLPHGC